MTSPHYAAGDDVAGRLVAQGWAPAYRRYSCKYVSQEQVARNAAGSLAQLLQQAERMCPL